MTNSSQESVLPVAYYLKEVCDKYRISMSSLYREIHANRLRMYKRGKRSMIERAEAERWFQSMTHNTDSNLIG